MITIRIHKTLDSESLPELRPLIGKRVKITVTEDSDKKNKKRKTGTASRYPLHGSVLKDDSDPFGPAVPPEDWGALQ